MVYVMTEAQKKMAIADIEESDSVRLRRDAIFREIGGGRTEVLRKAGTQYPVVDVFVAENGRKAVILEDYIPALKNAWFVTLGIEEVELVWKCGIKICSFDAD